jgi:hypothetical protein
MANPYQGLFSGQGVNSLGGVQQAMMREKNQRIAAAMAQNSAAGGNYYSNLIAKSNAQLGEAAKGMVQGLAGGSLGNIGGTKVQMDENSGEVLKPAQEGFLRQALPQDPRLSQAMKRDTDRREILGELGKFTAESSDGGSMMTEGEMRKGYAMLLERGYVDEAAKFLAQAQAESTLAIDRTKASNKRHANSLAATNSLKNVQRIGNGYKDSKGTRFDQFLKINKDGTQSVVYIPWGANQKLRPVGELEPIGSTGQTPTERTGEKSDVLEKETVEYLAKDTGKAWNAFRTDKVETGILSSRIKSKMQQALDLASKINSGGLTASIKENVTDFFGSTPGDVGLFNKIVGDVLIKELKKLGTRPTDADLKYLEDKLATLGQSKEVNMAILEDIIKEIDKDVLLGDALVDNPKWKLDDLNKNKDSIWNTASKGQVTDWDKL